MPMKADVSQVDPLEYNLATRVNIGDSLRRISGMFPDRVAVVDGADRVTYAELNDSAEHVARALLDLGLPTQSPVAMLMMNSWRFLATYYGCAKSGMVAMPVNIVLTAADQRWILADAEATVIVVDAMFAPRVAALLPDLPLVETVIVVGGSEPFERVRTEDWDAWTAASSGGPVEVIVDDRDIVQCLYTSGTTSRPKGVLVSHVSLQIALLSDVIVTRQTWGLQSPTMLVVLPMFHTTALNTLTQPMLTVGGTAVLLPAFDPNAVLDLIERENVTHTMMLPMMWAATLAAFKAKPRDVSGVTTAIYAMAPMPDELLAAVDDTFTNADVILGSGQTEVVPATVMQFPEHRHSAPTSWGSAVPTLDVSIMQPGGGVVGIDETGEIVYRGGNVCSGYWNNPAANASAFAGGWFHSGDVGHIDKDSVVWFTDRVKDIIKSGGENVSSVIVERVIGGVPGVAECCVVGVPDERWGEAVTAVVVSDGSVPAAQLADDVVAAAKQRLAGFQVPKTVRVLPELPKTATGKVQKHEVRAALRE